jgi:UV DNA damage endonuclease
MIRAIGYAGICLGLPERSITRTTRLANATPERLRELIQANLTDLLAILRYNRANRLCMFRINQGIVPFVSHPVNTLAWWEEFGPLLRESGEFVMANCLRVSMHPGQYTVLNSENPTVVEAALADVAGTCRVLDTMGLPPMHKIVIHGGSGKPDRPAALGRLMRTWERIPDNVRARLVLENDDKIFSAQDLLPVCRALGTPMVFDWLHHHALPGAWAQRPVAEIMAEVAQTWQPADGPPKVHFSSQDPDKRAGAHAYWLNKDEFLAFAAQLNTLTVDVMAECKGKDHALLRLRDELGWESLECGEICPPLRDNHRDTEGAEEK